LPTKTFFNLPEEKRDKLLHIARAEFARVPYADVSINRIIREAGIPRGSFYMYFKDKEELLRFLLGEYGASLSGLMEKALLEQHGDLFAAFLAFYDTAVQTCSGPHPDDSFQHLISFFRLNAGLHIQAFQTAAKPKALLETLFPHIDQSLLSLQSETDLSDMFSILIGITAPALCGSIQGHDLAGRTRYTSLLNILKRGMAAPAIPLIKESHHG